jgi:hypothetical protein
MIYVAEKSGHKGALTRVLYGIIRTVLAKKFLLVYMYINLKREKSKPGVRQQ